MGVRMKSEKEVRTEIVILRKQLKKIKNTPIKTSILDIFEVVIESDIQRLEWVLE